MVIATTSNKVLKIEGITIETLDQDNGLYYGLAKTGDGFLVASRHHDSATILYHYCFNKEHNLQLREKWTVPTVGDVHGIAYVNRRVYLTDTAHKRVVSFDIDNENVKTEDWLGSHPHINTIEFYQNCFYIAGLTNNKLYRQHSSGEILFDKLEQADGIHTIKPHQGSIWVCSSNECTVKEFSTSLNRCLSTIQIGDPEKFMSRGLAWDNGLFYCGMSPRGRRNERHELTSQIYVKSEHDAPYTIELKGEGQVCDLLAL